MTKEQYNMLKCLVEGISEVSSNCYVYDDAGNKVLLEDCHRWLDEECEQ